MKLFKKVSAAILAGVMALSMMVGCASTVTPGTPDVLPDVPATPDAGSAAEIINYMNVINKTDGLTLVTNDEVLADQASKMIDAVLKCGKDDNDSGAANGMILLKNNTVRKAFNEQVTELPATSNVYYANAIHLNRLNTTAVDYDFYVETSRLVYTADDLTKANLANFGRTLSIAEAKVGVATKTVGMYTVALIVVEW